MWMKANQMPSVENQFCDASERKKALPCGQGFLWIYKKSPAAGRAFHAPCLNVNLPW